MVSEVRQQSARSSTRTQGALHMVWYGMVWYGMVIWYGMVQHPHQRSPGHEHSAGIQMFNLFIAWQRTNFPGIFHHKKNHFSIHI